MIRPKSRKFSAGEGPRPTQPGWAYFPVRVALARTWPRIFAVEFVAPRAARKRQHRVQGKGLEYVVMFPGWRHGAVILHGPEIVPALRGHHRNGVFLDVPHLRVHVEQEPMVKVPFGASGSSTIIARLRA